LFPLAAVLLAAAALFLGGCIPQEEETGPAPLSPKITGPVKVFCVTGAELARKKKAGGKKCCTPAGAAKCQPGDDAACCVEDEPAPARKK
jgi:hypothetical protein